MIRYLAYAAWAFAFIIGGYILITPNGPVPINELTGVVALLAGIGGIATLTAQGMARG